MADNRDRELGRAEERYRAIFESNPLPLWVYDLETLSFLAVNDAAIQHYGYSREEFLMMTIKDIRPEEDIPSLLNNVAQVTRGFDAAGIWRHRKKNGTIIFVEITSHTMDFGGIRAELVLANDVTERLFAQEELIKYRDHLEELVKERTQAFQDSEERYRGIFEQALDSIVLIDAKTKDLVEFNSKAYENLGFTRDEFLKLKISDFDILQPSSVFVEYIDKISREGYEIFETQHRKKNGEIRDILVSAKLITLTGRKVILAIWHDITERKHSEEEIKNLNEEIKAFSYSVSHDLRAPLRAISGFSKALLEDYFDKLDPKGRQFFTHIQENVFKMDRMIEDMLALSRLGRKELVLASIDMVELATLVFEEIKQDNPGRNIQFTVGDLPKAHGDVGMVHQVVFNLLSNAVKFSRTRDLAVIEVGFLSEKGKQAYYVKDNGVGFNMDYADKLFRVFQRLHNQKDFEGFGVGLNIVQHVISRHGGRVWAEGKVDQGATFYFTLPV